MCEKLKSKINKIISNKIVLNFKIFSFKKLLIECQCEETIRYYGNNELEELIKFFEYNHINEVLQPK